MLSPSQPLSLRLFTTAVALLVLLSTLAGAVLGVRAFQREDSRDWEHWSARPAGLSSRLDVDATVVHVDPQQGTMKVELRFQPRQDLLKPGSHELAHDIEILTDTAQGPQALTLHRDRVPHASEVTLDFTRGDVLLYPLDRYTAVLDIEAHELLDGAAVPVPLQLNVLSRQHLLQVRGSLDPASTAHALTLHLELQRPAVTRVFAWFMNALMVIIAISAFIVAFNVCFRDKKPEANLLVWMSALLFVLPAFRNMLPGSPPLGALSDYLVFFWVEGLVACCLLMMVIAWYRRGVVG